MKGLLGLLGVLAVAVLGTLGYLGLFSSVSVTERDMGPYPFVYVQDTAADFSKVGELTEALGRRLDAAGYTVRKPAQVFFPAGRGIQNQIGFVVDRAVTLDVLGAETYFRPVPVQRCLVTKFPFRTSLSFVVGHWRARPALAAWRKEKGYRETSVMVILEGDSITFLQPIGGG